MILVAAVPQIEGFTVESMLELAKTSVATLRHLLDKRDWDGLNPSGWQIFSTRLSAQNSRRRSRMLSKKEKNASRRCTT